VIRHTDLDAANDRQNRLGGLVGSADLDAAKAVARRLDCGSVWINRHGAIQPNAPFGGVKQSGFCVQFAEEGLKEEATAQVIFC
jgi:acyl-CoA reductase-like NAD-dependent aldehyde dehydrogenase